MVALQDTSLRRGTATFSSPSGDVTIRIRTRPLPDAVKKFLLKHAESMKHFLQDRRAHVEEEGELATEIFGLEKRLSFAEFRNQLTDVLVAEGGEWKGIIDRSVCVALLSNYRICAFGPRRIGPNILVDSTDLDFRRMYSSFYRSLNSVSLQTKQAPQMV
jgi:ribosome assembly protein 1